MSLLFFPWIACQYIQIIILDTEFYSVSTDAYYTIEQAIINVSLPQQSCPGDLLPRLNEVEARGILLTQVSALV